MGGQGRWGGEAVWGGSGKTDAKGATAVWARQLPSSDTDLGRGCWTSLATPVGYEVLDVWLGWTNVEPLKERLGAQRRGEQPPRGLQLGRQLDGDLASYRAVLGAESMTLQAPLLVTAAPPARTPTPRTCPPEPRALTWPSSGLRRRS